MFVAIGGLIVGASFLENSFVFSFQHFLMKLYSVGLGLSDIIRNRSRSKIFSIFCDKKERIKNKRKIKIFVAIGGLIVSARFLENSFQKYFKSSKKYDYRNSKELF